MPCDRCCKPFSLKAPIKYPSIFVSFFVLPVLLLWRDGVSQGDQVTLCSALRTVWTVRPPWTEAGIKSSQINKRLIPKISWDTTWCATLLNSAAFQQCFSSFTGSEWMLTLPVQWGGGASWRMVISRPRCCDGQQLGSVFSPCCPSGGAVVLGPSELSVQIIQIITQPFDTDLFHLTVLCQCPGDVMEIVPPLTQHQR